MRQGHNLKSSTYYANHYSMYGLVAGIAFSLPYIDQFFWMISIILVCPFIGKIIGTAKDRKNTQDSI